MKNPFQLNRELLDAVIFDLDGVITKTAAVHAAAWKQLFDEFLQEYDQKNQFPFIAFDIENDYLRYVDGKPRYDGTRSFLESRNIHIPFGTPEDPPSLETICGLGNRKNSLFLARIEKEGAAVYDSTITLVQQLRQAGFHVAVISASKDCQAILQAAGVEELFEVRVDGVEAATANISGKPAPDIFLEAARRLKVDPTRTAVVEDSLAGVQAGRAGEFAHVIGVNRSSQPYHAAELEGRGADIVVHDLAEISVVTHETRRIHDLPSGMQSLEKIKKTPAAHVAIFLDYDGTLSPIVERPEDANLKPEARHDLQKLAEKYTVAVVSGRDLADVRARVGMDNLIYAGSHGFDIAGPDGLHMMSERAEEFLPTLDITEKELIDELAAIEGAQVERKKFTIAIHFRRVAPEAQEEVKAVVDRVAARHENLRKAYGKMVIELQPRIEWHKGKAILWLLEALKLDPETTLPIYIGDDITDEDAFKALPVNGIGIAVKGGNHPTAASYSLENTEEVHEFIRLLSDPISS